MYLSPRSNTNRYNGLPSWVSYIFTGQHDLVANQGIGWLSGMKIIGHVSVKLLAPLIVTDWDVDHVPALAMPNVANVPGFSETTTET